MVHDYCRSGCESVIINVGRWCGYAIGVKGFVRLIWSSEHENGLRLRSVTRTCPQVVYVRLTNSAQDKSGGDIDIGYTVHARLGGYATSRYVEM